MFHPIDLFFIGGLAVFLLFLSLALLEGVKLWMPSLRRATRNKAKQPLRPLVCRVCGASIECEIVYGGPNNTLVVDRLCNACIDFRKRERETQ